MELKTAEQRVAYLVQKVPATRNNYKLLLLLYWQVFDGVDIPKEVVNAILDKGTEPESIGRLKRKAVEVKVDTSELIVKLKEILSKDMKGDS